MSDRNRLENRVVWFDIPVSDLGRARVFYAAVLNVGVQKESFDGFEFCVLEHGEGNGGCLVVSPDEIAGGKGGEGGTGVLIYLNVDGRIRDACAKVKALGGVVLEPVHAIGPHGFRAIIRDSEGNRVALHSERDG